jgi:tol-pal system protein YbgF
MRMAIFVLAAFLWLGGVSLPVMNAAAQTASDAGGDEVAKRIQRLEEQIVDLNAQLGTIESMSQGGGGGGGSAIPSVGGGGGGSDEARLADLETQMRAMSAQFGEILNRLSRIEGKRGGSLGPSRLPGGGADPTLGAAEPPDTEPTEQGTGFSIGGADPAPEPGSGGFGTSIEQDQPGAGSSGNSGASGKVSGNFDSGSRAPAPATTGGAAQGVRTSTNSSPEAQSLYKKAYDSLVQRNYRGAADSFQQFVQTYPTDPLAGSAYHWLGEAAFTNGEYRVAADSFLKSSTNYPNNEKAPESLLKLGISLKRLGENKAACSSFAELGRRFPTATPILQRAEKEKSRAQC